MLFRSDVEDGPRQHDDTGDRGNPYPEDESPPQASQDAENGDSDRTAGTGAALGLEVVMQSLQGQKVPKAAAQKACHDLGLDSNLGKLTEAQLNQVIKKAKE